MYQQFLSIEMFQESIFGLITMSGLINKLDQTTILILSIAYYVLTTHRTINIRQYCSQSFWVSLIKQRKTLVLEGSHTTSNTSWSEHTTISGNYSDEFIAVFSYIIDHGNQEEIHQLKYLYATIFSKGSLEEKQGFYVVDQATDFRINANVYGKVKFKEKEEEQEKKCHKTKEIELHIYSYTQSLQQLQQWVNTQKIQYLQKLEQERKNKVYIYSLISNKQTEIEEDYTYDCWKETQFETTRTFNNLFFPEKEDILTKIDFFLNNKDYYYEKGLPYTLGIGLHGLPGTGKTSFIKALAKYTNRHIISLSFKLIKTKKDLETFYYEGRYSRNNKQGSIGFDKKIIVLEDIDCADKIVWDRDITPQPPSPTTPRSKDELTQQQHSPGMPSTKQPLNEPITLDDILNTFDGIRETPGRILIMTSNHFHKLDKALIRPGRIDINLELKNATPKTIKEIYHHFFGKELRCTTKRLQQVNKSPAEITNCFLSHGNNMLNAIECMLDNSVC